MDSMDITAHCPSYTLRMLFRSIHFRLSHPNFEFEGANGISICTPLKKCYFLYYLLELANFNFNIFNPFRLSTRSLERVTNALREKELKLKRTRSVSREVDCDVSCLSSNSASVTLICITPWPGEQSRLYISSIIEPNTNATWRQICLTYLNFAP